jgi:VanZ family protein
VVLNAERQVPDHLKPSRRGLLFRYGPLVLWIALIFFFSSTAASASQTSRIIGPILHFLFPSTPEETIQQYHFFIRKCAHFTEYALLAFWAIWALTRSSHRSLKKYRFFIAVVIVLFIASIDEFNQSFEPSRTSSVWDVGLDLIGGATMATVLKVRQLWSRHRAQQPKDAGE